MKEFITNKNKREYTIRYMDLPGKNIPIIMIAGWGCSASFDFTEVASYGEIIKHRRILVDLLGSGFSDKPDDFDYLPESHGEYLYRLVEELELDKVFVLGHSMGGRIATDLAMRLDSKLEGLILIEGSMKQERFPYMRESEQAYVDINFDKYMERLDNLEDRIFYSTARLWTPISMYRSALSMMREDSYKWADTFFKANFKKVFIYGLDTKDNGFDIEKIKENNIKIISVKKAGHTMAWNMPEETSNAVFKAIEYINEKR